MKSALRTAVVGAGGIANGVHLPALSQIGSCQLVGICDRIGDRAEAAARKFSIPAHHTSLSGLLNQTRPEAVFVLVQPDQMYRLALECMERGCHVFVEKPMGITLFQAESLARAAQAAKVQCQVGFNRRFIPLVERVVERMRALGPVNQVDGWFYKHGDAAFYDGCASAFTCDAIHTIDLVRSVAGAQALRCLQLAARYGDSPVDNAWNALIAFENGVTGTVHANYAAGGRVHGFAVHNQFASAYINLGFGAQACSARILHHMEGTFSLSSQGAGRQNIEELDGLAIAGSGQYHRYYGYFREDELFVRSILSGREVPCGAEDALLSMRLAEQLSAGQIRHPKGGEPSCSAH